MVDRGFQCLDVLRPDARGALVPARPGRCGQVGAEDKEVVLDLGQELIEVRIERLGPHETDEAVQLVHRAVGLYARVVLADPLAGKKARFATVARAGVDAHAAASLALAAAGYGTAARSARGCGRRFLHLQELLP